MQMLFALILLLPTAHAASLSTILSERTLEKNFPGPDLVTGKFIEYKKRVDLPNTPKKQASFMTDVRFAYSVSDSALIEKYAVIQWIRGCMFHSRKSSGRIEKTLTIYRRHFDEDKVFDHRVWEIDSDTHDPIYTSDARYGRHALLRWNSNPQSLDPETATFYARAHPPHGSVFATDLPGLGALNGGDGKTEGSATNSSLQFRTCLFNFSDLPETTTTNGDGIDTSRALWCVDWSNQFVWDYALGKMTQPKTIDAVCGVAGP
jgi:hypothetical protein